MLSIWILGQIVPGVEEAIREAAHGSGWEAVMLIVVIVAIALALWRGFSYICHRLLDEPDGLIVRYVIGTEVFLKRMEERDIHQQELCSQHASNSQILAKLFSDHQATAQLTHEAILALVRRSEDDDAPFSTVHTNENIQRFKAAAIRACEMCRHISRKEFPNSADEVDRHCSAIENIIRNSKETVSIGS